MTHGRRRRLPAARDQSAEHAFLRGRRIQMKKLRVAITRKADDRRFRHLLGFGDEALTDMQVFKIEDFCHGSYMRRRTPVMSPAPASMLRARTSASGSLDTSICVPFA